jgi:glycosyltransferase involved in cell wall biosynthesis
VTTDAHGRTPRLSVGLPIFNGERYLREVLESILGQTFTDFELIISDNASTDATREICEQYARQDDRIRYHRNSTNIGGAANTNLTFQLARGTYFRWAGDDDLIDATLFERCVEMIEADPSIVLCYSWNRVIDENGDTIKHVRRRHHRGAPRSRAFTEIAHAMNDCEEFYGVIRSSALAKTDLMRFYTDSDRTMLAHLSLLGDFAVVEEELFSKRLHPGNSTNMYPDWRGRMQWFGVSSDRVRAPHWAQLQQYLVVIWRSPISPTDKLRCYLSMLRWIGLHRRWGGLIKDAVLAGRVVVGRSIARRRRPPPADPVADDERSAAVTA